MTISIVIPTFLRGRIALSSIEALSALPVPALEILLVDQTACHPEDVQRELEELAASGRIRWLKLARPSIPSAMNAGLLATRGQAVLFLDDDIVPDPLLVAAHLRAQAEPGLVAGLVLQPGQEPRAMLAGERFRFNSTEPRRIGEFMGGNFSIDRAQALALGGFDENFVGAAYRFEAEFAKRYVEHFGAIRFDPAARIRHLAASTGGTRAHGHHLRTAQPNHSVGAYYYLLRARPKHWLLSMLLRPLREVRTRHHLRKPWWIPATLLAEARGWAWAIRLSHAGPRLMQQTMDVVGADDIV